MNTHGPLCRQASPAGIRIQVTVFIFAFSMPDCFGTSANGVWHNNHMRLTGGSTIVLVVVLGSVMCTSAGVTQSARQRPIAMTDLTVPKKRLPAECTLSSRTSIEAYFFATRMGGPEDRATILNIWGGGNADRANPWIGTDISKIANIRQRLSASPLLPDPPRFGPALLAEGVEEAYIAIYSNQSDLTKPIVVYALRFAATTKRPFYPPGTASNRRFEIGPVNGIVSGDDGQCSQTVGAYLKSLAK
jgi:hypothetical protein